MADTVDLQRFKKEVSDRGIEGSLPKNLPDYWLAYLLTVAEHFLDGECSNGGFSVMTAAIVDLAMAKIGAQEAELSYEELLDYFQQYSIELGLETVARNTGIDYEAATLETIFTHRDVHIFP
jgi:hypothetical protein